MTSETDHAMMQTRRQFLGRTSAGIGSVALTSLLNPRLFAGLAGFPNFAPKAKRVIICSRAARRRSSSCSTTNRT